MACLPTNFICYRSVQWKKELDKIIKSDKSHAFENAKDALKGAVEGKLPVQMKDGKIMPIEMKVVLKFDPSTGSFDIRKE